MLMIFLLSGFGTGLAFGQNDQPPSFFAQPFNPKISRILLMPAYRQELFRESDMISIQVSNNLPVTVFDLRGNVVYDGNPTKLHLSRGHYFVETIGDRTQFVVLPDDYAGASFLGTDADNGWSPLSLKIEQIHPGWVRTGAGTWLQVQRQRDVWDWKEMDNIVAHSANRRIIAVTGDILPSWVRPEEIVPLHTEFVRALAKRYKGKLAAIEVWNEPWYDKFPNTTNLDGLVHFYLDLLAQARTVIKSIDPKPMVIGPGWGGQVRLESLKMAATSLDLFDGWSWHDYGEGGFAPDHDYLAPAWMRSISKEHLQWNFGEFATRKPLFVDELGLYGQSAIGCPLSTKDPTYNSNLGWYRGMCRAIKITLLYRAAGVVCIMPEDIELANEGPNPNNEIYGWDYGYRGPHPKTSAFFMTCYWLKDAEFAGQRFLHDSVFLYAWRRPDGAPLVFAWCPEGTFVKFHAGDAVRPRDIYGRDFAATTIGEEPLLFQANPTTSTSSLLDTVAAMIQPAE
jgi:hypothetical protein